MTYFPNRCIKCKKTDLPLKEFIYARSIMAKYFKTVYIKIPVCENCEKDFIKYEKMLRYLRLKYCLLCIFSFSIFLTIAWSLYNPYYGERIVIYPFIISIITGSLTLILLLIHWNLYNKNTGRISKYIEFKMDGSFEIKDPEYRKEYEEFVASYEDEIFNCPKCNTQLLIDTDFCHVCGRDVRGLQ
jgi:hypothetical protein